MLKTGSVSGVIGQPKFITPEQFGAKNDGVTDDTAAIQASIDAVRATPRGGRVLFLSGTGYRVDGSIDCYPSVSLTLEWETGATIHVGLSGASSIVFKGTHPTTPATRGGRLTFINVRMQMRAGFTGIGPVFIEKRYASDLSFQGVSSLVHYFNNTLIRVSSLYNCDFHEVTLWGGGHHKPYKTTPGGLTFSITAGATALTASASVFDAGDVGRVLVLGQQLYTIASVASGTSATTTQTAAVTSTATAVHGFDGVRGSMVSGAAVLTMEHSCLVASDVGRVVYVLNGKTTFGTGTPTPKIPLRATIVSVDSGTQATLDTACDTTVTTQYVAFSPVIEIFGEPGAGTNDFVWDGLHIEEHKGAGLVLHAAINVSMPNTKLHCHNNQTNANNSTFGGIFAHVGGHITGDFEGTPVNAFGRLHISGQTSILSFDKMMGVAINDQPLIKSENFVRSGVVSIGDWSLNSGNISDRTFQNFFPQTSGSGRVIMKGAVSSYDATYRVPAWTFGVGTPEAVLTAPVGSLYTRTDGGAVTTLYVKETGTGNTGWVAK